MKEKEIYLSQKYTVRILDDDRMFMVIDIDYAAEQVVSYGPGSCRHTHPFAVMEPFDEAAEPEMVIPNPSIDQWTELDAASLLEQKKLIYRNTVALQRVAGELQVRRVTNRELDRKLTRLARMLSELDQVNQFLPNGGPPVVDNEPVDLDTLPANSSLVFPEGSEGEGSPA